MAHAEAKGFDRFKFCFLLGIFILFLSAGPAKAEAPSYFIKAVVDLKEKKIQAAQKVHFTNTSSQEITDIYFHIYPNREYTQREKNFMARYLSYFKVDVLPEGFQSGAMQIFSVREENNDLSFKIEGSDRSLLRIVLPKPLKPNEKISLNLSYEVKIPHTYGRFGWYEKGLRLSRWYPILSVLDDNGWNNHPFYPFHRPFYSESADYSVEVTVPDDQVVVHSGLLTHEEKNSNGEKTLNINTELPIREFTLALNPDYRLIEEDHNGVKIRSFYLPGDEFYGRKALEVVKDLMADYSQRFGPYPYKEFSIAPVHLAYGGEQMSNLIFIDTRVYQLPKFLVRYFDFLIAHETGHQWFYNLVGTDEFIEMWLEEGVNSYFISEYLDKKYGPYASIIEYPRWAERARWLLPELTFRRTRDVRYKVLSRGGLDHPVVGKLSSFQEPSSIFSITYGKGSRIVQMLKDQIGEEAFNRVFARIFNEYRFGNLSIKGFIELCKQESQKDLDTFFNEWLYTKKKLNYSVQGVRKNKILLKNKGGISTSVPVKVSFKDNTTADYTYNGQREIVTEKDVKTVTIDPQEQYLDIDQTNNHWPRKFNIKPVPLYFGLYDVPLFLPEDSYNMVIGPELITNGIGIKTSIQKPYEQFFYGATGYEFGEQLHKSRIGYEVNNIFETQTTAGIEIANRTDLKDGDDDLVSGKLFLRKELWPAAYGTTEINDHISLYLLRNRSVEGGFDPNLREDTRNISYLKDDEAIVGTLFHFGRFGPSPDPIKGFKIDTILENSGHFLGGTQSFTRSSFDLSVYQKLIGTSKLAVRFKYGWGFPDDKNLYQLGGVEGLRGYDRKTIRGANAFLSSVEYRFPIRDNLKWRFGDNLFAIEAVSGVVFFDAGQAWFNDFDNSTLKKDAGLGLRFTTSIGSFLEKIIVRADVAQAINEPAEDTRFWFGINHAF